VSVFCDVFQKCVNNQCVEISDTFPRTRVLPNIVDGP